MEISFQFLDNIGLKACFAAKKHPRNIKPVKIKQIKFKPAQFTMFDIKPEINKENILILKINDPKLSNKNNGLKPRPLIPK